MSIKQNVKRGKARSAALRAAATEKKSSVMTLSNLKPLPGSHKKGIRVGRGEGSGSGKTSGKGGKGQTARSGGRIRPGFEGGQMPLYRRVSKYGFRSQSKVLGTNRFNAINLDTIQKHFEAGSEVTEAKLLELGFGRTARTRGGFKLLGRGEITKALTVTISACSADAQLKIEKAGGKVNLLKSKSEAAASETAASETAAGAK
jgi:large subunit ribosomal protein L15